MAPTLGMTVAFINQADDGELDRVSTAVKERRKALQQAQAATVTVGAHVRLTRIRPKYLVGTTGSVQSLEHKRTRTVAEVLLDEKSTEQLRGTAHGPRPGEQQHMLAGVPASCCELL